jgi:hypothetical protein
MGQSPGEDRQRRARGKLPLAEDTVKEPLRRILTLIIILGAAAAATAQPIALDEAIASSAKTIASGLADGTRVAVINCTADSAKLSEYVVDQTAFEFVNLKRLVVVERKDIELVKGELEFQLSGDVSDESAQSIGKMLGAEVIVTASFDATRCLRMKAIAVETARVLGASSVTVVDDARLKAIGDDRKVIEVSNLPELIQAIGPDRIIKIAPGTYDLSQGYKLKNKYVTWIDEYDGPCPVIKSVSNLALIGEGKAKIVIKPAYGWVFSFETCSSVKVDGLILGHTVPGYCLGGVLRFKNCDDVEVRSCELYGSGTYGIGLERASNFRMENCDVHDCTYGLATIERSSGIAFTDTAFRDTGEFELVEIRSSDGVSWTDCSFDGNHGSALFACDDESRDVALIRCAFSRNDVETFCDNAHALKIDGARFSKNSFAPVGD